MAGTSDGDNEPAGSLKFGEFLDYLRTVNFSRRTLLQGLRVSISVQIVIGGVNPVRTTDILSPVECDSHSNDVRNA